MDFTVPADNRVKLNESEKKDKYPDIARELQKKCGTWSDSEISCNWCTRYSHQGLTEGVEDLILEQEWRLFKLLIKIG